MGAERLRHVAIVGGGIAGIAAAMTLIRPPANAEPTRVTLFESRRRLGGRASSFVDAATGDTIDNCQHITLACCTNYLSLLDELGVSPDLTWHKEQYWLEAGDGVRPTRETVIAPCALPAPGQYAWSFLKASFLSAVDKIAIAGAMARIAMADLQGPGVRGRTFLELLQAWDQPETAIARFWEPVIVSACNLSVAKVHAPLALKVFQDGFLANARAGVMGVPSVPLVRLYDAAERILSDGCNGAGGGHSLRLGVAVTRISPTAITLADGSVEEFDRVICAVPPERVAALVDPACVTSGATRERLRALDEMTHSPIVGVHLRFREPVMRRPHHVLIDAGPQWIFRKDEEGRVVHAVISGADEWMALEPEAIVARVVSDLGRFLPSATMGNLAHARAVKERRATFAGTPAFDQQRPALAEVIGEPDQGIVLAGDSVQTGWPATMESAARSGRVAAAAVLGMPEDSVLTPDLHPSFVARFVRGCAALWSDATPG